MLWGSSKMELFLTVRIMAKNRNPALLECAQRLWNPLIPNSNSLVAKAVQQSRALYSTRLAKVKRQGNVSCSAQTLFLAASFFL